MHRAGGKPLQIEGVASLYIHDLESSFLKKIKIIVTIYGCYTLILPRDQKRMLLLDPKYPCFLGMSQNSRRPSVSSSESESDGEEEKESKEEMVGVNDGVDKTHQTHWTSIKYMRAKITSRLAWGSHFR